MEILTNLQKKILSLFTRISDQDVFYLTGGTALSAFFLKHRKSNDLDFFTQVEEVILVFSRKLEGLLKEEGLSVERARSLHSFVEIQVRSVNGESTIVHLGVDSPFRFEEPFISDEFPGLKVDSLSDIASNKLLALFGRAAFRDFIDIYFLLEERFSKEELIEKATQKDPGFDLYWLGTAFTKINDFFDDSPDIHLLVRPCKVKELKDFFATWREEIAKKIIGGGKLSDTQFVP